MGHGMEENHLIQGEVEHDNQGHSLKQGLKPQLESEEMDVKRKNSNSNLKIATLRHQSSEPDASQ